jgi:hypothetical protein
MHLEVSLFVVAKIAKPLAREAKRSRNRKAESCHYASFAASKQFPQFNSPVFAFQLEIAPLAFIVDEINQSA